MTAYDMTEIRFFYVRDDHRRPMSVVAYRANHRDGVAEFGVATHNPADEWDRERGKAIAAGRLEKSPYVASFQDESPRTAIRYQLLLAPQVSSRVRRAIRHELARWQKSQRRDTDRAPSMADGET